ncbi:MAG: RecX family transcriptional regulator [Spirochaetia bacterium]|nr:RecX family transcriptional regulator [Spirochaetia bacterium]
MTADQVFEEIPSIKKYVSSRERCASEIKLYLHRKGVTDSGVQDDVIKKLQELGLLDDRRFAKNRAAYRYSSGYGPMHVRSELSRLRIARDIVDEASRVTDDAEILENAFHVATERLPALMKHEDSNRRIRQYLMSRGFTSTHVEKVVNLLRERYPHWGRRLDAHKSDEDIWNDS